MKNNLKKHREQKKLTQDELANKVGISRRAYQYYEADVCVPDVHTANKLAKELGTTSEELFPIQHSKESMVPQPHRELLAQIGEAEK